MMSESILRVDHLSKSFGGLKAVNDLSFELETDGIHSLIGPNGAGKTTTVNMLMGVYPPDSGTIVFNGKDISRMKSHQIARLGLRRTFQNIKLFHTMTVLENLMVSAQFETSAGIVRTIFDYKKYRSEEEQLRAKAEEMLKLIGLYERRNDVIGSLPYGRQKVAELAMAAITSPKVILLDEPAAGLNPSERMEFIEIVKQVFDSGIRFLMIEHNMDVVMSLSKKITVLDFGSKIAEGLPEEIRNNDIVIKAYLGNKFKKQTEGD